MESYINIDKNMVVNTTIGDVEVAWHDARRAPFSLHGLWEPETTPYFCRVPDDVAAATSEGVDKLSRESAGGRVRFSTNSPYIAVRAKFLVVGRSSHLSLISTSGFDLYIDGEYGSRFVKEFRMQIIKIWLTVSGNIPTIRLFDIDRGITADTFQRYDFHKTGIFAFAGKTYCRRFA